MNTRKLKQILKKVPGLGSLLVFINRRFLMEKVAPYDEPSLWLQKLLKDEEVRIVQIGSNDGANGDPIFDLVKRNNSWKALFVEPVPYLFERLKSNYGSDSRFSFENVAINDGTKQKFYSVKKEAKKDLPDLPTWYDQLGSFDKENILKHLDGVLEPYIEESYISGVSLEELFRRNNIEELSLLHIDTEGYDWKILSQLNLGFIQPKIILVEHKHLIKIEKKHLINFLKPHYLLYSLGGDIIGILKDYKNKGNIKELQGELIA